MNISYLGEINMILKNWAGHGRTKSTENMDNSKLWFKIKEENFFSKSFLTFLIIKIFDYSKKKIETQKTL